MRASCLPSIALPQSLTVFALIAASLWRYRPLSVSVIGMCTARLSCWILSGAVYISVTSAYQRVRRVISALWWGFEIVCRVLPRRSPRGLLPAGPSPLLYYLWKSLCNCVCFFARVCVCVCPQSISDGTRYRFLPLKCSNKTNTANWLLLPCMLMCLFIEVVPVQYMYLCMYKQRKRECKNMNRIVYRMQNLSQIMNPETSLQFCGLLIKCLNYNSDKQEDPHYIHSSPEWNICILTPLGFYELWRCWSRELTCVIFGDLIITGRLDRSHLASACDHVWLQTQRRKELNVWRMPNLQEGPSDNEFVVDSVTQSF